MQELKLVGINKRIFYNPLKKNKGVALIMAMAALMLILYLAMEVTYDTNVEYVVNSQHLNRIKAYYAARSGMELSLLRIKIFQKVSQSFGKQLGPQAAMLDEIWKFPFAWPLPIPKDLNAVDKDTFDSAAKKSIIDTVFMTTIVDEGSKIDVNDLGSQVKKLREATQKQILGILNKKWDADEDFSKKYEKQKLEELVINMADWVSNSRTSLNGGDKKAPYRDYEGEFPPNRGFRTMEEIKLVAGMTDEIYELLLPSITIYGMKGINPNIASTEVLSSLDTGMTQEVIEQIIKRRDDPNMGGAFKDKNDFWSFVQSQGARLSDGYEDIPLLFESVFNFKVKSVGTFGNTSREITAIVMDINKTADQLKKQLDDEKKLQQQQHLSGVNPTPTPAANSPKSPNQLANPKGPPRIVYWNEK